MIKIAFTGCGLGDFIYKNVDFSSEAFKTYASTTPGDGGLTPGKLVFTEELEKHSVKSIEEILTDLCGMKQYDTFNIGGPALVSSICTAQLLYSSEAEIRYYGAFGNDDKANVMLDLLKKLPINIENLSLLDAETPYTNVLSDPNYNQGKGERTFINNIGAAGLFDASFLNDDFWKSDMLVFGGTAIVPELHNNLTQLLLYAKYIGALTIVTTVYDFINEQKSPDKPWPLGDTSKSLALIDLLIMDMEEALRISGATFFEQVSNYFKTNGSSAFIITHGSEPTYIYSSGKRFDAIETTLPICNWIADEFNKNPELRGDTTGCGDNFAGATIASIAQQLLSNNKQISLEKAAVMGTLGGGFACYTVGGVYQENFAGQKMEKLSEMYEKYMYFLSLNAL